MDAEADHHHAVDDAAEQADAERDGEAGRRDFAGPSSAGAAQHHRRRDPGQRVDRAHRQVDPAGDDDDGGADRHDREEAGVGRGLDQRVRVEEVVDRLTGDPVGVRAGEHGEQGRETEDDQQQAGLRRAEDSSKHRMRPASVVVLGRDRFQPAVSRSQFALGDSRNRSVTPRQWFCLIATELL